MATPETIEKMRALECSKFRLTEEQYLILHKYLPKIDKNKTEFFQPVGLSDTEADILRSAPHEYINVSGHDIQINVSLIDSLDEYSEQLYFVEHDNDPIEEIGIDIETYSSVDLTETGVYPYAEADDFEILLFAYSVNGSPVRVIDLASGEKIPQRILDALTDKSILKTAYNAAFERVCLSKYLGVWLDADDWDCTMVRAARLALPLSLAQCGEVLGLTQKKMTEGKALITYFSKPCKPTKVNGGRTRNLPEHAPDKWEVFKRYNKRDVEVEQAIRRKVVRLEITDTERRAWLLDQRINDRGVLVDMQLAQKASDMDDEYRANITEEAIKLTGLENPNSVSQLKEWLKNETGLDFPTLDKETVKDMLPRITSEKAKRVLRIRQELGKSSTAKYKAMLRCACKDNRIRGLFQFYGANRSGRFAGRLVQLQNLVQNHLPDLDRARNLVKNGDMEDVAMIYGNVPQTLSELIRTALIAKEGCTYHVCDFSAIEARVIAWLAGENWVLEVFRKGGDIYCATASQMFHCIVEKHGRNAQLRQKGKIATLACGYGGGVNALKAMGADKMGLTDAEMNDIIKGWRNANPNIVRFWKHCEQAALHCIRTHEYTYIDRNIKFEYKWGGLCITLPSKRQLFYPRIRQASNDRIAFDGMDQEKKIWRTIETYGGRLAENITQAIARDCLVETMLRLDEAGYKIVFHIHDETVIEATPDQTLEGIEKIFAQEIPWAKGLPLKGAGYTTPYYLKD